MVMFIKMTEDVTVAEFSLFVHFVGLWTDKECPRLLIFFISFMYEEKPISWYSLECLRIAIRIVCLHILIKNDANGKKKKKLKAIFSVDLLSKMNPGAPLCVQLITIVYFAIASDRPFQ